MAGNWDIDILSASFNNDRIAWHENMSAPIPAVSHWRVILMSLLLLAGGTILISRRRATGQTACT